MSPLPGSQILRLPSEVNSRMQERVRGAKYDALVEELLKALTDRYGPSLLVHWEDFGAQNSYRLLANARAQVSHHVHIRAQS